MYAATSTARDAQRHWPGCPLYSTLRVTLIYRLPHIIIPFAEEREQFSLRQVTKEAHSSRIRRKRGRARRERRVLWL
jgi:hypothetical protein